METETETETETGVRMRRWTGQAFADAIAGAKSEFHRTHDAEVTLWAGSIRPETVWVSDDRIDVYFYPKGIDATWWAARACFQASHEAVHVLCGPRTLHWTHEVAVIGFSFRHLLSRGLEWYADVNAKDQTQRAAASTFTRAELLRWDGAGEYDAGLHAQAYVLGHELEDLVGWPAVHRLTLWPYQSVDQWLASLPNDQRVIALSKVTLV